jgi:hypothetical protein
MEDKSQSGCHEVGEDLICIGYQTMYLQARALPIIFQTVPGIKVCELGRQKQSHYVRFIIIVNVVVVL